MDQAAHPYRLKITASQVSHVRESVGRTEV